MAKTKRKWIQLDPNHPDALMAHHIYIDTANTVGAKIDNHENRITILENGARTKVSDDDTTAGWLSEKIVAGTNVSIDVLNSGSNEQIRITAIAAGEGGGGDPVRVINVAEMVVDDTMTGVDAGKAFGMIDTVDFNQDVDGAIWATTTPRITWDTESPINASIMYVLEGTPPTAQNVKLGVDIYVTYLNGTPSSVVSTTIDIEATSDNVGKLLELGLPQFDITSTNCLITVKVSRLASDSGDTYEGTLQLAKIKLTGQFPSSDTAPT